MCSNSWPSWVPKKQMTLGLDLQGGSHILLEVVRQDIVDERLNTTRDEIRTKLRDAKIGYTGLGGSGHTVQVRIRDAADIDKAKTALADLLAPVASGVFGTSAVTELTFDEPEPGLFKYTLSDAGIDYRVSSAVTQSIEVVGKRVNELGTTEPIIQRQGTDRILVQVPGLQDPQRLKDILGQTAKLTFQMVDQSMPVQEAINGRPPAGSTVMYGTEDPPVPYLIEDRVIVSGENLVDAQATFDQRTSEPVVSFRFDGKGAQRFGQATQQNVGAPVCHHPRQPGDLGAADPRADPRRQRPDFRPLHHAKRQRPGRAAARRRAAGNADHHRRAHRRPRPRPGFDPCRQGRRHHRQRARRRPSCSSPTACSASSPTSRWPFTSR